MAHKNTKHGMYGTPTYNSWASMKQRCYYEKHVEFHRYGAQGVRVCARWHSFENFLADMGIRPPGTTIDRRNSRGDYEPSNCWWATKKTQANNCANNTLIRIGARQKTISQWAEVSGISAFTISKRLRRGWAPEDAVFKPNGTQILPNLSSTQFKPKLIKFDGMEMSQQDWAQHLGLANSSVLMRRIKAGWPLERALRSGPVGYPRPPRDSTK